jgi:hypothetical protein
MGGIFIPEKGGNAMRTTDALRIGMALGRIGATLDAWEESKHPRRPDGKFGSGGGTSSKSSSNNLVSSEKALSRNEAYDLVKEKAKKMDFKALKNYHESVRKQREQAVAEMEKYGPEKGSIKPRNPEKYKKAQTVYGNCNAMFGHIDKIYWDHPENPFNKK